MFMPLGLRTFNNIKNIIKEEMDNAGAQELLMPSLIPEEYYEVCGRVASLGSSMFHLKDRYSKPYVLGPTHEELFTVAAKNMVRSYKDLPLQSISKHQNTVMNLVQDMDLSEFVSLL